MDGDEPEPIEVELISHDPPSGVGRGWRRRTSAGGEGMEPDRPDVSTDVEDDPEARDPSAAAGHRRLVIAVSVTAVLALALGWMLGRVGDSGEPLDELGEATAGSTTTTTDEPAPTLPILGEGIDGADFGDDDPAVVTPFATTTTTVVEPTVGDVGVDARLVGAGVRLVGVELGGVLVESALDDGTLVDFGAPRFATDGSPLVAGDDWVLVSYNGRSRVVRSDGTVSPIDLGDAWQVLHVPGTDRFWSFSGPGPQDDGLQMTLVGLDGEPLGPTLDLPPNTWPLAVDPANGGVVVSNVSRNYAVHLDGVEYLGIGAVVGLAPDVLVTYDCDETFTCSLFATDRATGVVERVPTSPDVQERYQIGSPFGWGSGSTSTVSPDGRWVAVVASSWRTNATGIVELATGRFVELAGDSYPPTVVWSSDGRFAFTLDDQVPTAYDTVNDERFPVFTDTIRWIQLAGRPAPGATTDAAADGPTLLSVAPQEPIEG